ncbi:glycosyltransferase family 1 protein [Microbacterium sp. ARD32]|uniref:glycosyltransferase family 1 protein n=1 Tax=Microbacterium sp. ARD32 TaxID=2962577 RepID=UPI002882C9E5|nr:glycosyltransferase family 1 protein [Microbacterium sp. ARD32]MDT0156753.1 glycosyltransferase family 1 protein [Microbacterium sp. ARD32]
MSGKPRLLIISFSVIERDARVLRQIRLFADDYEVTTLGHGEAPAGVARHIRVPDGLRANDVNGRLITLRQYTPAYWRTSAISWARKNLEPGGWDIVLANEADAVPLALRLKPRRGVHADLHEYHPRVKEELPLWNRRIRPYVEHLCRRFVSRADSWTTVGEGIAAEYERMFGFRPEVVANAAPYQEREAEPASTPLRLVHSGGAVRARHLELTVQAVRDSDLDATLDLYLTPNDPAHLQELKDLAAQSAGRVRVLDPVPYAQLADTIAAYDVGIHVLPPVNFNHLWALPNKLYDYVQARLAVVIGPSPEMARIVSEHGFGVVADGFETADLVRVLDALTPESVTRMKHAAAEAAPALASDAEDEGWRRAIDALAQKGAVTR